jgi:hypothetical protein
MGGDLEFFYICRHMYISRIFLFDYLFFENIRNAVGHGVTDGADSRLTCEVGSDSCRRGARRQNPGVVGHGGSITPI